MYLLGFFFGNQIWGGQKNLFRNHENWGEEVGIKNGITTGREPSRNVGKQQLTTNRNVLSEWKKMK
jgi:hypothetical protein